MASSGGGIPGAILRAYVNRRFGAPPIILGGAPRSGTTLLLSVLGSHPHIYSIDYETASLHPRQRPLKLLKFLLLESKTERRRIPAGVTRFCEKTPGNILHGEAILALFRGRVRIVNIVRDGRDVVTSRHPLDPARYWVATQTWVRYVRQGQRLVERGDALGIRYEDLVARPRETLEGLCAFIDEPFDERMLAYQTHTNVKSNLAWFGEAKDIHGGSLRKWDRPEHAQRVADFLADPEARALSEFLGYVAPDRDRSEAGA